jgi:nitroimidazol reductase NimA-like FMN-containing flavoprotein (pyridoxamine 5'-phosphate oxidase superfamily)
MIKILSREESLKLLRSARLARLGCVTDEGPYVVPVSYVFDGESVFIHSLPGRKVTALRADPRACLQVDDIVSDSQWRSVIVSGLSEEVTAPAERARILGRLFTHYPLQTPVEAIIAQDAQPPNVIVFRIRVDKITGVTEE